jgi:hypothetical protein
VPLPRALALAVMLAATTPFALRSVAAAEAVDAAALNAAGLNAAAAAAAAAPEAARDFDPTHAGWNGMAYLVETAKEADVAIEVGDVLDFGQLRGDEVIVVVAPRRALDEAQRAQLLRFVAAGGRVVLADDFAAGASWLTGLGIRRLPTAGASTSHVEGRAQMPVFSGRELGAFLGFQVGDVTLNHPASFVVDPMSPDSPLRREGLELERHALGRYADGVRAWLVEVRVGRGRLLALADPSVLIDGMLRGYHGDKQFAANLLRWGCYAGERCAVTLLSRVAEVRGVFTPQGPRGDAGARPDLFAVLRRGLARIGELARRPELAPLRWLLALLALALPPLLVARMPRAQLPLTAAPRREHSRLHDTVAAWLAQPAADFRRPARQLAVHLSRLVVPTERRDGVGIAELRDSIAGLVEQGRLSARAGQRLGEVVAALGEVASGEHEVDRARFTAIAAEVEWAEHVLSHTAGLREPPRAGGLARWTSGGGRANVRAEGRGPGRSG